MKIKKIIVLCLVLIITSTTAAICKSQALFTQVW
jgi:hypothetical protein